MILNCRACPSGVNFPRPLSATILPASFKVHDSGSNFFKTVMEQSRATWLIVTELFHTCNHF